MSIPTVFPFTLSLVFAGCILVIGVLLFVIVWRGRAARADVPGDLPVDPERFGPVQTNRWLRALRLLFTLTCVAVLAFHGYWASGAPGSEAFERVSLRDQRNRRLAESGLKGWVFDRSGGMDRTLVRYRRDGNSIVRDYPLGEAAVHVTGYSDFIYGSAGIERAYQDLLTDPSSTYNALYSPAPVGSDLTTTIDVDLQREAYSLLKGKRGAVVVLSVPTCEVLAMASSPSFDPAIVTQEEAWKRLNERAVKAPELSPMTDRALKTYYLPGSTFKVLVTVAALESGLANERFTCTAGGFVAPRSSRPILDDSGGSHGNIGLADALRVSCNQYFAQMGLKLGTSRLAEVAQRFGIESGPPEALRDTDLWRFKAAESRDFLSAFAPPPARVYLPAGFDDDYGPYSLAIEAFGQGPNQMTILQLALIAAAVATPDGQLFKPTLEVGVEPTPIGQVCSPQTAATVREMMRAVVENGTASRAFGPLRGRIAAGGKTGTAQREVTVYDPNTLEPVTRRDRDGNEYVVRETSVDALFIGFAPYDTPSIAFAVIVEDGGHGGQAAAPIAVKLIQKAAQVGLIAPRAPGTAGPRQARGSTEAPGEER